MYVLAFTLFQSEDLHGVKVRWPRCPLQWYPECVWTVIHGGWDFSVPRESSLNWESYATNLFLARM